MYFKQIESEGLAHYSYFVGEGGKAAVIDPRRDIEVYLECARKEGLKITHIFETHRNEDYIIGSMELAEITGASVYLSGHEDLGHVYGERIFDGDEFHIGNLRIQALHTPGHTLGHLSYVLYESNRSEPYMVFTGDCLFMGDLGRTDFYGEENLDKMTGLLYDSVFNKLMPLGEDTLVFPAHGAGSACGEMMEDRPFTTLGYEKVLNPELQISTREEFIKSFGRMRIKPRYFENMEIRNIQGAPFLGNQVQLTPMQISDLKDDYLLLDCRSKEAYFGGHIPGSVFISKKNLSSYLGTLFEADVPLVLITESKDRDTLETLYWYCKRIGFDNIIGFLPQGTEQWLAEGKNLETLPTITAHDFLKLEDEYTLLDIRTPEDLEEDDPDKNLVNIPLQILYKEINSLNKDHPIFILCGSGDRSTTAAAYLKNHGYDGRVIAGGVLTLKPLI